MRHRHDVRMVPAAAAAWTCAGWAVGASSRTTCLVAVAAVVVTGGALAAGRVRMLVVAAAVVAAVAGVATWRLALVESSPLAAAARHGAVATLVADVREDAREASARGGPLLVVGLDVTEASGRFGTVRDPGRVTVFVRGDLVDPDDLVVGRTVRLLARLSPSDDSAEVALGTAARVESTGDGAWWWSASQRLRTAIRAAVARGPDGGSALVPALVAGDEQDVTPQMDADFRRTGTTHLLAVSGTNLTIVVASLLVLARSVGVRRRGAWLVGLLGAVFFVLLARPEPSVLRAAAMGLVALAATGYGTRGGVRSLAWAVVVLLLLDPWLSRSWGFALSVAATLGILVLTPWLLDRLDERVPRPVGLLVGVPLAAQAACTPLVAAFSGQVSLVAVLANLLVAPVVAPATVLGLLAGLLGLAVAPLGTLVGVTASWCAEWVVLVAGQLARWPGGSIEWERPVWWLVVLCAGSLLLVRRLGARPVLLLGASLGLVVAMWRPPSPGWPPAGWLMVACDVGQGDMAVLDSDAGAVVVDTGPEPGAADRCLRSLGVDRVALVVLTHGHADHVDGWAGVRSGRDVDAVLLGPSGGPPVDVPSRLAEVGERIAVGDLLLTVLGPASDRAVDASSDAEGEAANDASVVLMAQRRGVRILLTGDVEPPGQEALLRSGADLAADVLKVPHHGSARQSIRFLAAVLDHPGPRLATVSAGRDNDYGHPARAALRMLDALGATVARTDRDGDVAVVERDGRLGVVGR